MSDQTKIQKIREFIQKHHIAVISTVSTDAKPESSLIGIVVTDDLDVYFATAHTSHKWRNLQKNSYVSLVIGHELGKTVQYIGEATEIVGDEAAQAKRELTHQSPTVAKFISDRETAFFKVTPKLIRMTDASVDPWEKTELKF